MPEGCQDRPVLGDGLKSFGRGKFPFDSSRGMQTPCKEENLQLKEFSVEVGG